MTHCSVRRLADWLARHRGIWVSHDLIAPYDSIIRRAYGFHSVEAALATIMFVCGPVNLQLPYHTPTTQM